MTLRFSIVTISFNQARWLNACIDSVLDQQGVEIEYIVCDPGSTDGSRAIVDSYRDRIAHRVFERDGGPADGLNRGFARATGDIFAYLNSDDTFLPGAFATVARYFAAHPDVDVVTGHALVTDAEGNTLRRVWSEPFGRRRVAYGASIQIQPATFIRADAFRRAGGFEIEDRSNWDGTLLTDLYLSGARIRVIDSFLGTYRLHGASITMSGRMHDAHARSSRRRFEKLMRRPWRPSDRLIARALRLIKHATGPVALVERLRRGPIFGRPAT